MNVLVVDDEKRARETLIQLCKLCCPEILSFAEADSVSTAVSAIKAEKPDLVFLDISLGDGNGFDILKQLEDKDLNIIFVTAHNEYGLKALKASAIDYLLKPLKTTELIAAVKKAREKISQQDINERVELLVLNMESEKDEIKRIIVKTVDSIHVINVEDIIFCESDKGYTTFHLLNQTKILSSKIVCPKLYVFE